MALFEPGCVYLKLRSVNVTYTLRLFSGNAGLLTAISRTYKQSLAFPQHFQFV